MTLGIMGYGKIGKPLETFAKGLGFQTLVFNRQTHLNDFLKNSDIISINLPLKEETQKIISEKALTITKAKYIVNTSRGGLVDEKALLNALNQGTLLGYATDVFEKEPIDHVSKELMEHPQVIGTPHLAAFDPHTAYQMTERGLENIFYALTEQTDKVRSFVKF